MFKIFSCNAYIDHNPDACPFDHSLTDPHIEDIWDDGEIYEAAPQPKEAVPQPAQIAYMCAHGLFATCVCLLRNSNPFLNHVRSRAKIRLRWTTRARAKWHVWHGLKFTHGYGHGFQSLLGLHSVLVPPSVFILGQWASRAKGGLDWWVLERWSFGEVSPSKELQMSQGGLGSQVQVASRTWLHAEWRSWLWDS